VIYAHVIPAELSLTWSQLAIGALCILIFLGPGKTNSAATDEGVNVRSEPGGVAFKYRFIGHPIYGGLFIGLAILLCISAFLAAPNIGFGEVAAAALVFGGLFFFGLRAAIPVELTTKFNFESQRILRDVNIGNGLHKTHQTFSFDEISGVDIKQYKADGFAYEPVLSLKNGKNVSLARQSEGAKYLRSFEKATSEFCTLTGLPNLYVPPSAL
jgi:hypothetical protein